MAQESGGAGESTLSRGVTFVTNIVAPTTLLAAYGGVFVC